MDDSIAKRIARGDVDPTTLLPMVDINPAYQPSSKQPKQQVGKKPHSKGNAPEGRPAWIGKKIAETKPAGGKGGLFNFFGENAIIPPASASKPFAVKQPKVNVVAGLASGKRTLAEVMDSDIARKKQRKKRESTPLVTHSKFFGGLEPSRRHSFDVLPHVPHLLEEEKENFDPECIDEADASDLSVVAQARFTSEVDLDFDQDMEAEVAQEDGYMSPLAPDSPAPFIEDAAVAKTSQTLQEHDDDDDDDFGAAVFSSPTSAKKNRYRSHSPRCVSSPINPSDSPPTFSRVTRVVLQREDVVLEEETPVARRLFANAEPGPSRLPIVAVDLRSTLGVGTSRTELDFVEVDQIISSSSSPECSPETPADLPVSQEPAVVDVDDLPEPDLMDPDYQRLRETEERRAPAVQEWTQMFSYNGSTKGKAVAKGPVKQMQGKGTNILKRSNTNVTPAGRHSLTSSARGKSKPSMADTPSYTVVQKQRSVSTIKKKSAATVNFFQPKRVDSAQRAPIYVSDSDDEIVAGSSPVMARMYHQIDSEEVAVNESESRLSQFR
jgi:hypothetical protein